MTARRLAEAGIACIRDLLLFFPRSYEDYRDVFSLDALPGMPAGTHVVVRGKVVRVHKFFRRMLDVVIEDGGCRLRARWFRPNAGMAKGYVRGAWVALAGRLRRADDGTCELIHPSNVTAVLRDGRSVGIRPRYPVVDKVPGRTVEKIVRAALALVAPGLRDPVPVRARRRLGLPELDQALQSLHAPADALTLPELEALRTGRSPALRRFAFEGLLVLQVALMQERRRMQGARGERATVCATPPDETLAQLRAALPFELTPGQSRTARHILRALATAPLQCLLQGDVGSGKTAVAFAACVHIARAGAQSLLMAPTTVLAEQHQRTLQIWGERIGVSVGLLHSGLPAVAQRRLLDAAAAGEVDVIVGTHALLEERLQLPRLGLAIVDEQHRFGVEQRARLRRIDPAGRAGSGGSGGDGHGQPGHSENGWKIGAQGGMVPHLLVLSATPIPRTLALALYGDLDLVTLDGLPPGRQPVRTQVVQGESARHLAYAQVKRVVAEGGQAFVVCPAIAPADTDGDGDERRTPRSVLALARELRPQLGPARIGVVHGKLGYDKLRELMLAFRDHRIDVLVATTVLEVGVDVPTATCMVVEDAERFGLAQLHQLRGRVGRGLVPSRCFLLTTTEDADALGRLHFLASEHDGFRVAEEDLRRRGAGDVHGTRQTGLPELRFAHLAGYAELITIAHDEAGRILREDPDLAEPAHAGLRQAVVRRLSRSRLVAEEAG